MNIKRLGTTILTKIFQKPTRSTTKKLVVTSALGFLYFLVWHDVVALEEIDTYNQLNPTHLSGSSAAAGSESSHHPVAMSHRIEVILARPWLFDAIPLNSHSLGMSLVPLHLAFVTFTTIASVLWIKGTGWFASGLGRVKVRRDL